MICDDNHIDEQTGQQLIRNARTIAAKGGSSKSDIGPGGEEDNLTDLVAELHAFDLLTAPLPKSDGGQDLGHGSDSVDLSVAVLASLGAGSLPIARLYEGHVNAIKLVRLYGNDQQWRELVHRVQHCELYGVWGAEGKHAVRIINKDGDLVLDGTKRFASGIDAVTQAVVPVENQDGDQQLLILDVSSTDRADLSTWTWTGMRASNSGSYDFTDMDIDTRHLLGQPGDFIREPWFIGGIWRCAAAQLGAIEQIVEETRCHLQRLDRLEYPFQLQRLGQAIIAARSARLWVRDAASKVEADDHVTEAVAAAGMARLVVERAGMEVMQLAQRSVGLAAFDANHPLEPLCRDLSVYLRQAAPDALLLDATRQLLSLDRPLPGFGNADAFPP